MKSFKVKVFLLAILCVTIVKAHEEHNSSSSSSEQEHGKHEESEEQVEKDPEKISFDFKKTVLENFKKASYFAHEASHKLETIVGEIFNGKKHRYHSHFHHHHDHHSSSSSESHDSTYSSHKKPYRNDHDSSSSESHKASYSDHKKSHHHDSSSSSSSESHEVENPILKKLQRNFMNQTLLNIKQLFSTKYSSLVKTIDQKILDQAANIKNLSQDLHLEIEKTKESHPQCQNFSILNENLYKEYLKDVQCCVDSLFGNMAVLARLFSNLCTNENLIKIIADSHRGDLACYVSSQDPSKCYPHADCEVSSSPILSYDQSVVESSVNTCFSSIPLVQATAVNTGLECSIDRTGKAKRNLQELRTNYLQCLVPQ